MIHLFSEHVQELGLLICIFHINVFWGRYWVRCENSIQHVGALIIIFLFLFVRVRNRCEVSGRPRAYYRKLKMSRIALRELGSLGYIPGIVKSSW